MDETGNVILCSEGYQSEASRDNGIQAVVKNMGLEAQYKSVQLEDSTWVLSLRAGNNQEIARSCPKTSENDAWSGLKMSALGAAIFGAASLGAQSVDIPSVDVNIPTVDINAPKIETPSVDVNVPTVDINAPKINANLGSANFAADTNLNTNIDGGSSWGWLKWLLPLLLLLLLLWWLFKMDGCNRLTGKCDKTCTVDSTLTLDSLPTLDSLSLAAKTHWDSTLGEMIDITLPDGTIVSVPSNGSEKKLIDYLNSKCGTSDVKATWFNMDRLLFKTGSHELMPISHDQLEVLEKIFKAYPNTSYKIGGYTDNVGKEAANMKLSADRAKSTMQVIAEKGTDSSRMKSEGYGSSHPECPANDSEECKAKNRRVAIRVEKCE